MTTSAPLTRTLAEWAASLSFGDLPAQVVHHSKRLILDYLTAAVAGSTAETAGIVREWCADVDTNPSRSATVFGTAVRLTPPNAAFANGTASHGLEIDDGYTPGSYHPGGPNLSAILAAAEADDVSSQEIILATVVGYELSCRLAEAGHPATWRRGFHNTPIAGVFGAAAGVSKLRGADANVIANAMGLAGSHAGGLFEFLNTGSEVKRLHAGKAARDGLICAQLAARGVTGPTTVLEGESGYGRAFAGRKFDGPLLMRDLGQEWRMTQTYIKPYPCCRHLHGPIDAVLRLAEAAPIDIAQLQSVIVETYTVASRHNNSVVGDFLSAQMSIPYAVAVTLLYGAPTLEHFRDQARHNADVRRLMELVQVRSAAECERDYPANRPARVILHSAHGPERALRIDQPYGEPANPVSDNELAGKFRRLCEPVLGAAKVEQILPAVWTLDCPQDLFRALGIPAELSPGLSDGASR